MPFLLGDPAQKLDTGFAKNVVENHCGSFKDGTFESVPDKGTDWKQLRLEEILESSETE